MSRTSGNGDSAPFLVNRVLGETLCRGRSPCLWVKNDAVRVLRGAMRPLGIWPVPRGGLLIMVVWMRQGGGPPLGATSAGGRDYHARRYGLFFILFLLS